MIHDAAAQWSNTAAAGAAADHNTGSLGRLRRRSRDDAAAGKGV